MSVTLLILEHSGDYNHEETFENELKAHHALVNYIVELKGYWTKDSRDTKVFVPWHRVDAVKFEDNQ